MSDVANPGPEATQAAETATPASAPTSEDAAAQLVQSMLDGEPKRPTSETRKDKPKANQPEPTDETDTGAEAEAEDEPDDELGEDDAEDDDAEALDDDEEELDTEEEPAALHTVKVDGEEIQVTLDEALKGYQRQADYQRKTAAIATDRQQHETHVAEAKTALNERFEIADGLLSEALQSLGVARQPDPDLLDETNDSYDPDQYRLQEARFNQSKARIDQLTNRIKATRETLSESTKAERAKLTQAEGEKLRKQWPALDKAITAKDDGKRKRLMGEVKSYAINNLGFSEEQVSSILDHRHVLLLRKAMFYDRNIANAKIGLKKVKAAPKMTGKKPGASADRRSSGSEKRNQSRQTLRRTGSKDAAAAYVQSLFD